AGRALLAREADSNGARYLNEALESFHQVGAVRDEARVRRRLRRAGIRPLVQQVASSARPKLGWDAVSSAELRVVRLVAQGLTNRQVAERLYLSTYTVGTHLKHVFDKVGITSRVELTRLAVERGSRVPTGHPPAGSRGPRTRRSRRRRRRSPSISRPCSP